MIPVRVFTPSLPDSSRLEFVLNSLFPSKQGFKPTIIHNENDFKNENGIKINYSNVPLSGGISIPCSGLLSEKKIIGFRPEVKSDPVYNYIFFFGNERSEISYDIPFDVFASAFWLLSRQEEFQPQHANVSGDFSGQFSLAWQHEFLSHALIQRWTDIILQHFKISFPLSPFSLQILLEMDGIYHYKFKSFPELLHIFFRDVKSKNYHSIIRAFQVLSGKIKDPADNFDFFYELVKKMDAASWLVFWNTANITGVGSEVSVQYPQIVQMIKQMNDYAETGLLVSAEYMIHPDEHAINVLIQRLRKIIHGDIQSFRCPDGYFVKSNIRDILLNAGIIHDYSCGYNKSAGFRNSSIIPVSFFDMAKNKEKEMNIHPVVISDSILFSLSDPEAALDKILMEYKKYGGEFNLVVHQSNYPDGLEGNKRKQNLIRWISKILKVKY